MLEVDCLDERSWFMVHVGTEADFVVRAFSEDHALLKTTYYCYENPIHGIDPDSMLDYGLHAKPLDPVDEDYFDRQYEDKTVAVRFLAQRISFDSLVEVVPVKPDPAQGQLFEMDKYGRTTYSSTEI